MLALRCTIDLSRDWHQRLCQLIILLLLGSIKFYGVASALSGPPLVPPLFSIIPSDLLIILLGIL